MTNGIHSVLLAIAMATFFASRAMAADASLLANGDFEAAEFSGWAGTGDVHVVDRDAFEGKRALLLTRPSDTLPETNAVSDRIDLAPGTYDIACAVRTDLYAQDMSFNTSIQIEFLDRDGKALARLGVVDVSGKTAWRPVRKRLTAPEGTAGARFVIGINKTHGQVWLDAVSIKASQTPSTQVPRRVVFATKYIGNMLYPDDKAIVTMNLRTPQQLPEGQRTVEWDVRDYWGAPLSDRRTAALTEKGKRDDKSWEYSAALDASDLPLKAGLYYEVHTSVKIGNAPAAEDQTSFAILPQSSAFQSDPGTLPFGTHNWDDRPEPYFALSARMGLRRCAVFWHWPAEAPYTPHYEGWEYDVRIGYPKKYGLVPYAIVYPAYDIERGDTKHTDESLREGLRQTIELHKKDGMWGFQIGNEPPHWNEKMLDRDAEIYKVQYEAIKKADPSMFVIGSAIGPSEEFFKRGFQFYCDAMNIHGYGDLGEQRRNMRRYQELFAKYGGKKPIWTTEIGSMSQGLTRHEIACDIVRKASAFFADGGEFFTWFAITYPDPTGTRRGSYGDSMDLFSGVLEEYNPRLDAVGYFHYIDQMGTKKFVTEQTYPSGATAMLFRDAQGNCLQVVWNIAGEPADVFVPLADVQEVRVTHIDGSGARLGAGKAGGITLRVGSEPTLLSYRQPSGTLAEAFAAPAVALDGAEPQLVQGGTTTLTFNVAKDAGEIALDGPKFWTIEKTSDDAQPDGGRRIRYSVGVPAQSPARSGRITVTLTSKDGTAHGHLLYTLPVNSTIHADIVPIASTAAGKAGVELVLRNNGDKPQNVGWAVEIASETPMAKGEFDHGAAQPANAYFTDVSEGRLDLTAGEEKRIALNMAEVDPLTLYKVRSQIVDAGGKAVARERFMGGFAGVHKIAAPVAIDGVIEEAVWSRSPVLKIDDARQFFSYEKEAKWNGPADLSGDLRFLWDDRNLYISVAVTDDVYSNPKSDSGLWSMDGVQFLLDPYRDRLEKLGRYDYYGGVGEKGPQMWCGLTADGRAPTGEAKDIQIAGHRDDAKTGAITYEIAIPWSRIAPFVPSAGRNLGIGFLLNEDDGGGRKTFLGWFSGAHSKTVNLVGDLILLGD